MTQYLRRLNADQTIITDVKNHFMSKFPKREILCLHMNWNYERY